MSFTLKTVMVEASSGKIGPVFSFEGGVIMGIVSTVTVMPAPGRISVISISRVISFIETYAHVDLGIRRIGDKTSCYDQ
jgi:hypothetical protein